jgi:methionine-S-sulfoxide reductase
MKRFALSVSFLLALAGSTNAAPLQKATFAAGCFWCAEAAFEDLPGVVNVISGYTGGTSRNPTYERVSLGIGGHRETVQVTFDPAKITYGQLLDIFWRNIDPEDPAGQFCDRGQQYLAAIYWHDASQRALAELSLRNAKKRFRSVATDVLPAGPFYTAEEDHQDYAKKNPVRYHFYRAACGRDARLKAVWK